MIAHAAQAGEDRGRVVVRLGACAVSSPAALRMAVLVASAFRSELEAIFIQAPEVAEASVHERLRFVGPTGSSQTLEREALTRSLDHFATAATREVEGLAASAGVRFISDAVRSDPIDALSAACSARGPWNIVAFAEPMANVDRVQFLGEALRKVWGTTAFIAAGPSAVWREGPIVAVVEDIDRVAGLKRAAEQLAAVKGDQVLLMAAGPDAIALDWLESEIRIALGDAPGITLLARPSLLGGAGLRAEIERLKPRAVIARYGGEVVPAADTLEALCGLSAPAFLIH